MDPEDYIKSSIVGFGLVTGLFLAAGVDPDAAIIGALVSIVQSSLNTSLLNAQLIAGIISTMITIVEAASAYTIGGSIGIALVGLAFIGGALIFITPYSIFLAIIAIVIAPHVLRKHV